MIHFGKFLKKDAAAPKHKGFYGDKRPRAWVAKRAGGSQGFRETLRMEIEKVKGLPDFNKTIEARYVVRGNEELLAKTEIESSPITDPKKMVCGKINFTMRGKAGDNVADFAAQTCDKENWSLFHRKVITDYKGLNLGRVSFRLMELAIKELGGKKIWLGTSDIGVVNTVLGLGWEVHKNYIGNLKTILGLRRFNRLPPLPEIRQQFREMKVKNDTLPLGLTLIRKIG